jgi:hypothetical protein
VLVGDKAQGLPVAATDSNPETSATAEDVQDTMLQIREIAVDDTPDNVCVDSKILVHDDVSESSCLPPTSSV